jgi:hypothetical protein
MVVNIALTSHLSWFPTLLLPFQVSSGRGLSTPLAGFMLGIASILVVLAEIPISPDIFELVGSQLLCQKFNF